MDLHDGLGLGMSADGASPNFQDRLHSLMEEADLFKPGSQERTNSLEQIRSMLADKGTTMRRRLGAEHEHPLSFGTSGRGHHHPGGSSGHGGFMGGHSPDDGPMLDDLYHDGVGTMMSSIPEKDNWNSPHYGVRSATTRSRNAFSLCTLSTLLVLCHWTAPAGARECRGCETLLRTSLLFVVFVCHGRAEHAGPADRRGLRLRH